MDAHPDRGQESNNMPGQERPRMPRWVKVFALIALAVLLVFVVVVLVGGEHGPGMHSSASGNLQHAVVMYDGSILL